MQHHTVCNKNTHMCDSSKETYIITPQCTSLCYQSEDNTWESSYLTLISFVNLSDQHVYNEALNTTFVQANKTPNRFLCYTNKCISDSFLMLHAVYWTFVNVFPYLSPQNLLVIYTQQTVETHELDAPATVVNTFEIQGIKDFKVLDPHAQPKVHGKASTMTSNYSTTPPHSHAHTPTRPHARTHARTHTHTHTP